MPWTQKDGYATKGIFDIGRCQLQWVRFDVSKGAHFHKIKTEYFLIITGRGQVSIDERVVSLRSGAFVKIRPNEVHAFHKAAESKPIVSIMLKTNNEAEDTYFTSV